MDKNICCRHVHAGATGGAFTIGLMADTRIVNGEMPDKFTPVPGVVPETKKCLTPPAPSADILRRPRPAFSALSAA
jgi:hypothetical protein